MNICMDREGEFPIRAQGLHTDFVIWTKQTESGVVRGWRAKAQRVRTSLVIPPVTLETCQALSVFWCVKRNLSSSSLATGPPVLLGLWEGAATACPISLTCITTSCIPATRV